MLCPLFLEFEKQFSFGDYVSANQRRSRIFQRIDDVNHTQTLINARLALPQGKPPIPVTAPGLGDVYTLFALENHSK